MAFRVAVMRFNDDMMLRGIIHEYHSIEEECCKSLTMIVRSMAQDVVISFIKMASGSFKGISLETLVN